MVKFINEFSLTFNENKATKTIVLLTMNWLSCDFFEAKLQKKVYKSFN